MSARLVTALARHAFFAGAPAAVMDNLALHVRWLEVEPDQLVLDFEDTTTDVYFIVKGQVRVLLHTGSGERTQILGDFAAGDVVGEMAAIDGVPRSARIETLVRTEMCMLPGPVFIGAAVASREIGLRLMRLLASRIRSQNRRLLEITALPIRLRLLAELLRLSRSKADGSRILSPLPTQEELASRIGARRETISREIAALAEAGLVRRERNVLILPDPVGSQATVDNGLERPRT